MDKNIEDKLSRAEYALREQFPGIGLLLIAVKPLKNGFEIYQVGGITPTSIRNVLKAALDDIDMEIGKR